MLRDIERDSLVVFPLNDIKEDGIICKSEIATRLLKQLRAIKADEELGYFLAVTELISIGRGRRGCSSHILFPVTYRCRTFLPQNGEVMIGTVHKVTRTGVFLKCGPMELIYLSVQLMSDYSYVAGETPFFLSSDQSRIEVNSAIRYKVFAVRWGPQVRHMERKRQFMLLATINESSLGPIQSAGDDALDFESIYPD